MTVAENMDMGARECSVLHIEDGESGTEGGGKYQSGNERREWRWESLLIRPFRGPQLLSVLTSLLYGFVAVVMGFTNKAVLNYWPYSNTLLTLQMGGSVILLYIFRLVFKLNIRPFEVKAARSLVPVVFFYNANVAFALAGLKALNIPIFNTLKRMTPVMVLAAKYVLGDATPSRSTLFSVFTIVTGCIITGAGDLSFNMFGYVMALMSCCLQTTYLILVERSGKEKGFSSSELLLYNAVLSLPVLLLLITITSEVHTSLDAFRILFKQSPEFLPLLIFSLMMGALLNYTLFLCTLSNSALTTTIVGALKGVVSTGLGFFLLGGVKATKLIVGGIVMNTLGGIGYTMAKYRNQQRRHRSRGSSMTVEVLFGEEGKDDEEWKSSVPINKEGDLCMPIGSLRGQMNLQALQRKSPQHAAAGLQRSLSGSHSVMNETLDLGDVLGASLLLDVKQ